MTKENLLTIRWNNILSLALGVPALFYVAYAFSNSMWMEREGLFWLAVIGAFY